MKNDSTERRRKPVFSIISTVISAISLFPLLLNTFMALFGFGLGAMFAGKSGASFSEMFVFIATAEGANTFYIVEIVFAVIGIPLFAVAALRKEKAFVLRIIGLGIGVISLLMAVLMLALYTANH